MVKFSVPDRLVGRKLTTNNDGKKLLKELRERAYENRDGK